MSSVTISTHIPDLELITSYAERNRTIFSRISPWTKVDLLILLILMLVFTRDLVILGGVYLLTLGAYIWAGLPLRRLMGWYVIPLIFALSLIVIRVFREPGIPLFSLEGIGLSLTDRGLILMGILILKTLISMTFTLLFLMTTRYRYIAGIIFILFPTPLDEIFLMAYRYLFTTLSRIGSLLKAVRSRGGGLFRSMRNQGWLYAEISGTLFIQSLERAERVNISMVSRGYKIGAYGARVQIPSPTIAEYGILGLATLGIIFMGIIYFQRGG